MHDRRHRQWDLSGGPPTPLQMLLLRLKKSKKRKKSPKKKKSKKIQKVKKSKKSKRKKERENCSSQVKTLLQISVSKTFRPG